MASKIKPNKKDKTTKKEVKESLGDEKIEAESINKNTKVKTRKKSVKKDNSHLEGQRLFLISTPSSSLPRNTVTKNKIYPSVMSISYAPSIPIVTTISPYLLVPIYTNDNNYQAMNWSSIRTRQIQNPIYSIPVMRSMSVLSPSIIPTQVCPFTNVISTTAFAEPMLSLVPTICPSASHKIISVTENVNSKNTPKSYQENIPFTSSDPESYLTLPKHIFPTARMLAVDPNPIIDVLCREVNIQSHSPWILDIEFGVPKFPVTRSIATYDVHYNRIHCKNTPEAIHPGFESSSQDFKRATLFYYDFVISNWYRGFMMMRNDSSVADFQKWLQIPMQAFGLCWP